MKGGLRGVHMPASVSGEAQMAFREGIATPVCVTLSWVSLQGRGQVPWVSVLLAPLRVLGTQLVLSVHWQ